jgi:hypothetical protein
MRKEVPENGNERLVFAIYEPFVGRIFDVPLRTTVLSEGFGLHGYGLCEVHLGSCRPCGIC